MAKQGKKKVIDFHVHIGLKEHWHEWVHDYQRGAQSEFYTRYEEMIDPEQFASYLRSHQIEKAVILPDISPITTGIVPNEYVLEFCRNHDIFIPFCTVNPFLMCNPAQEFKKNIMNGAKGLKLYPSYNHFYPNESKIVSPLLFGARRGTSRTHPHRLFDIQRIQDKIC